MRSRDAFVRRRQARWEALDRLLGGKTMRQRSGAKISEIARLYRSVCADLMQAQSLGCSADVTEYLDALAGRAHNALYAAPSYRLSAVWDLLARGFPRVVRANWAFVASATALFALPLALGWFGAVGSDEFAERVLPPEYLEGMSEAYAEGFERGRSEGTDSLMAGFYVYNNVGIAFRCFATGIFFGIGSAFFLTYNGLVTGTVLGYVSRVGNGVHIFTFICGHGPFELFAICLAGAAGLKLGYSLVATRGRTRLGSLAASGPELWQLILGTAAMLLAAAGIEGFWSPSSVPADVKWGFSVVVSLGLLAYFGLAGRQPEAQPSRRLRP